MRRLEIFVLFLIITSPLSAQKTVNVSGEADSYGIAGQSLDEVIYDAVKRAKNDALQKAFGVSVSYSEILVTSSHSDSTTGDISQQTDYFQNSGQLISGQWIGDRKDPEIKEEWISESRSFHVHAKVYGIARKIEFVQVPLRTATLCNGTRPQYANSVFVEDDSLYLLFSAPVDGWLTVYMRDPNNNVQRLLPYTRDNSPARWVKGGNMEHIFFSIDKAPDEEKNIVDEYTLSLRPGVNKELDYIYIVWSPNQFYNIQGSFVQKNLPMETSFKQFNQWLTDCRIQDAHLQLVTMEITINKK